MDALNAGVAKKYQLGKKKLNEDDYTDEVNQQYIEESKRRIKELTEKKLRSIIMLKEKTKQKNEATAEWEQLQMRPSELAKYEREEKELEFSIQMLQD